ncbi:MAG: hypothetical protein ACRD3D_17250 [Terriglobia bacterium]
MKKMALLFLAMAFGFSSMQAKSPPKTADFSGTWALDTGRSKNVPEGLDSYAMTVAQTQRELKVETTLKGDLKPVGDLSGPYPAGPQGGAYPGGTHGSIGGGIGRMGRAGGMGMPGGREAPMGEAMPGGIGGAGGIGGGGTPRSERRPLDSAAALSFYPSSATYRLDGEATTAQLGGPAHSDATLKASWTKKGQLLKMSLDGNAYSGMGSDLQLKDQWKLSNDGASLLVERSVRSRAGSTTVHLVFQKQGDKTHS